MSDKVIIFRCGKCGKLYQASEIEYRNIFWYGRIIQESYCPYCGYTNQNR